MVPKNHTKYEFPFNLKDRVAYIKSQLKNISLTIKKEDNGIFDNVRNKKYPRYVLTSTSTNDTLLKEFNFEKENKKYIKIIE